MPTQKNCEEWKRLANMHRDKMYELKDFGNEIGVLAYVILFNKEWKLETQHQESFEYYSKKIRDFYRKKKGSLTYKL